jgi:hypothetical protein
MPGYSESISESKTYYQENLWVVVFGETEKTGRNISAPYRILFGNNNISLFVSLTLFLHRSYS